MIKNPVSALVRISAEKSSVAVATGFIFHRERDQVLILTAYKALESALQSRPGSAESPTFWIEGEYQADCLFGIGDVETDLVVLRCGPCELSSREPLHLGQPFAIGNTRIALDTGLGCSEFKPVNSCCQLLTRQKDQLILRNNPGFPIKRIHAGSPVVDENWAVGVVISSRTSEESSATTENDLIVATQVEQLRRLWKGSEKFIAGPLPHDVAREIGGPVRQLGPFYARFLVAVSEPTKEGDLHDELAIIQETITRRLPRGSEIELWQWDRGRGLHRVFTGSPAGESHSGPSFAEFDAIIIIAWNNLGYGEFDIKKLERDARERGQKRLIYGRAGSDKQVKAFLKGIKRPDVPGDIYQPPLPENNENSEAENSAESFAERFGRDFQILIKELAETAQHMLAPTWMNPRVESGRLNPYRGLESYSKEHANLFNGRSQETTDLRNLLASRRNGFLAVVGASGSGKSSLVRAGLLRRLELDGIPGSAKWPVVDMRVPGSETPLQMVARKLLAATKLDAMDEEHLSRLLTQQTGVADVIGKILTTTPQGASLILFVDQFEEIFELSTAARNTFLHFLQDSSVHSNVHVIVTLRADFYPRFLEPELSPFVNGHKVYPLQAPKEAQMVSAVYWPAVKNGYRFEDNELFVQILRDAGASDGALPLLSYALEQLVADEKVSATSLITRSAYDAIGGVHGVVKKQVQMVMSALAPEPSSTTWNSLFSGLVEVGEDDVVTKKRADFRESFWSKEALEVKRLLVEKRLLTSSGGNDNGQPPTIELAHEALLQNWAELRNWINGHKSALLEMQRVKRAAKEWRTARCGKDPKAALQVDRDLLWRQDALNEVKRRNESLGKSDRELPADIQEFLRPEFDRLVAEVKHPFIDSNRRYEIGERLAQLGDQRPGVSLQKNGLPDIAWCYVSEGEVSIAGMNPEMATARVRPFYISKYPVTLEQFSVFTRDDVYYKPDWWVGLPVEPGRHKPVPQKVVNNHPAHWVSWYQATAFCNWLSRQFGYAVRLPTEWEWVQAATGGKPGFTYPWGNNWDAEKANHRNSAYQLMAVGMFPHGASPVGALDMVGNMYQWCLNEFDHPHRTDPSSEPRTTRGGAWFLMPPEVEVEHQLSIHHRLRDLADGTGDNGRRVAVCIRLLTENRVMEDNGQRS